MSTSRRYVVLPAFGLRSPTLAQATLLRTPGASIRLSVRPALVGAKAQAGSSTSIRVLDSLHEDGPKLVEMSPEAELNLRAEVPGLKIVPVVTYRTMRAVREPERGPKEPAKNSVMTVWIVDAVTGAGLPRAEVVAFTDFRSKRGDSAQSDASGLATLSEVPAGAPLDRLYIYPPPGYWGHYSASRTAPDGDKIGLGPIALANNEDLLARYCSRLPADAGKGVKVAIIDSGVARKHPALPNVSGGANVIFDETDANPAASDDWGPAENPHGDHGTHVAGIVGGAGPAGVSFRGVAPGVELRSYRVFPNNGGDAQNYDIVAAIDRAMRDGCNIINMSLGGGVEDEATRAGIGAALDAGVLVVAAAGNDYRRPVSFPAAVDSCLAVSAYGRIDTFLADSTEAADVLRPFGEDKQDFFAAFSNYGPQIDFVGPGVGIVSTLPEDAYGVMSGTSMACPAIVGFAAYLLGSRNELQNATGSERTRLWKSALYGASRPVGFGREFEGFGLPRMT